MAPARGESWKRLAAWLGKEGSGALFWPFLLDYSFRIARVDKASILRDPALYARTIQKGIGLLDPDVVFRPDAAAMQMGDNVVELRGAAAVAQTFKGRAQAAKPALIDGAVAVTVAFGGQLRIVLGLTFANGRIAAIDAIADPARIAAFDVETLTD